MAVREFNGSSDRIVVDDGIVGQLANGPFTLLVLVKPTTLNSGESYISAVNGSNWVAALQDNAGGGGQLALSDDNEFVTATVGETASDWQILAVTCAGPGNAPRFHRKQLGTGSWTHQDSGSTFTGNTIDAATMEFASTNNGAFSSFKDCRLAVGAVWVSALSDGQLEGIDTAKTTRSIFDLAPASLWDFNQAAVGTAVKDLMGNGANETTRSGTTVIAGDDPPGWTFGLGTYNDAVLALSPSSYWMDDSGQDYGSNAFDLTHTGSPASVASILPSESGRLLSAREYGASKVSQAGDNYSFFGVGQWSIVFWMKPTAAFGAFPRVLEKRNTAGNFDGWMLYGSGGGNITFDYDPGTGADEGRTIAASIDNGEVHMIAITFDDTPSPDIQRFYFNGVELDTKNDWTFDPKTIASTGQFSIGATSGNSANFSGIVEKVAVWSGTLLSAATILSLYNTGSTAPSSGSQETFMKPGFALIV